jgi:hypothetical protein
MAASALTLLIEHPMHNIIKLISGPTPEIVENNIKKGK